MSPSKAQVIIPESERAELVDLSRDLYRGVWSDEEEVPEEAACLFHACALQCVLRFRGVCAMLQAGSASWPRIRPEEDDGVCSTHYAYKWEGLNDARTAFYVRAGVMPEMHCWLATRNPDTIIDPTTGTWPARSRRGGFPWTADEPPPYLWMTLEEMQARWTTPGWHPIYEPDLDACRHADHMAGLGIYPRLADAMRQSLRVLKEKKNGNGDTTSR